MEPWWAFSKPTIIHTQTLSLTPRQGFAVSLGSEARVPDITRSCPQHTFHSGLYTRKSLLPWWGVAVHFVFKSGSRKGRMLVVQIAVFSVCRVRSQVMS